MELQSIAEGVESEDAVLLVSLGVDALQGYLIARPLPSQQLADWLTRWALGHGETRNAAE
jgi:EAL domain-containing protein (putative c-di-GMP-specific phosphodiesterase class I)